MKKSVLISLIALGISLIGLVIALAAWLHKKKDLICDDFDDDLLTDEDEDAEYIAAQYMDCKRRGRRRKRARRTGRNIQ